MSMIQHQIDELRDNATMFNGDMKKILESAADTIESLSAKLAMVNLPEKPTGSDCDLILRQDAIDATHSMIEAILPGGVLKSDVVKMLKSLPSADDLISRQAVYDALEQYDREHVEPSGYDDYYNGFLHAIEMIPSTGRRVR